MNARAVNWPLSIVSMSGGTLLGVTLALSTPTLDHPNPEVKAAPASNDKPVYRYIDPARAVVPYDDFGGALPVAVGENFSPADSPLHTKRLTIALPVDSSVEYKAVMRRGQSIVFAWTSNDGGAYFDFHGHEADGNADFFTRYAEGRSSAQSGSILAAYDGQHGWYWLNTSSTAITIELVVSGFFDDIIEVSVD